MSDRGTTHSDICWKWHHECAKTRIDALRTQLEIYEAEIERLSKLNSVAARRIQELEGCANCKNAPNDDIKVRLRQGFGGYVPEVCDEAANYICALESRLASLQVERTQDAKDAARIKTGLYEYSSLASFVARIAARATSETPT